MNKGLNSLLVFSLFCFSSNLFAEDHKNLCIYKNENVESAFQKIEQISKNSKNENSYSYSYSPSIELTHEILLKKSNDSKAISHYDEIDSMKLGAECDLQIIYSYQGKSEKDIKLKRGFKIEARHFQDVTSTASAPTEKWRQLMLHDKSQQIRILVTMSKSCTLSDFENHARQKGARLKLNLSAPQNAAECLGDSDSQKQKQSRSK